MSLCCAQSARARRGRRSVTARAGVWLAILPLAILSGAHVSGAGERIRGPTVRAQEWSTEPSLSGVQPSESERSARPEAASLPNSPMVADPIDWRSVVLLCLAFAAGVLTCLLAVVHLLPPLVRAECAEAVHTYGEYMRPEVATRVVVIDRHGEDRQGQGTHAPRRVRTPVRSRDLQVPSRRVDVSQQAIANAGGGVAESFDTKGAAAILQQVYEQNVQLREQLSRRNA